MQQYYCLLNLILFNVMIVYFAFELLVFNHLILFFMHCLCIIYTVYSNHCLASYTVLITKLVFLILCTDNFCLRKGYALYEEIALRNKHYIIIICIGLLFQVLYA